MIHEDNIAASDKLQQIFGTNNIKLQLKRKQIITKQQHEGAGCVTREKFILGMYCNPIDSYDI